MQCRVAASPWLHHGNLDTATWARANGTMAMALPAVATDPVQTLLTAFHEAGHAVMAHLCGRRLTLVEIDGDRHRRGSCTFVQPSPDPEESVESLVPCVHLERELLCLCAGMVCEQILCEDEPRPSEGWNNGCWDEHSRDLGQAIHLALQIVGRCDRVLPYLEAVHEHVHELMLRHWSAVEAVAAELLSRRRLHGFYVHRMVASSISP
jgi:hypothetical protein